MCWLHSCLYRPTFGWSSSPRKHMATPVPFIVQQDAEIFLPHKNAFYLAIAQCVLQHGAVPLQVQESAFVELHEIFVHSFLQPVNIPLPNSPALQLTATLHTSSIHQHEQELGILLYSGRFWFFYRGRFLSVPFSEWKCMLKAKTM